MATTPRPKRTLLSFLQVQEYYDRELYKSLQRASSDVSRRIRSVSGSGVGAQLRKEQLELVRSAMNQEMSRVMEEAGYSVMAMQYAASAAATGSTRAYDRVLFGSLGRSNPLVEEYMASRKVQSMFGIEAMKQRLLGTSYVPLSRRVYGTTRIVTGQVDRFVDSALAQGLSAREVAAGAARFILPSTPGGVSYAALRLGRTEINNSFHAVAADRMVRSPWTRAARWNLSRSHPEPDECDRYADDDDDGLGPGLYEPENIPRKPHPQCFCFVTPETVSDEELYDELGLGGYDPYLEEPNLPSEEYAGELGGQNTRGIAAWLPRVRDLLEAAHTALVTAEILEQLAEDQAVARAGTRTVLSDS